MSVSPEASIGPSYLMLEDIDEEGCLERVWKYGIIPLLKERFFGLDDNTLADFQLASLRKKLDNKTVL